MRFLGDPDIYKVTAIVSPLLSQDIGFPMAPVHSILVRVAAIGMAE